MFLARVITNEGRLVLAVREKSGGLLLLNDIPGVTDDPVMTINALGIEQLRRLVDERSASATAVVLDAEQAHFEVPVPHPQKIICVALNYAMHAAEGSQDLPAEPLIFFKPPSSLLPHNGTVRNPARSQRLDYEVELAVVIGSRATNVASADWRRATFKLRR
jgi:2-keto-4-pentenoate hydratase/2-oxohepta-3-ene-1,7-dioic acid hydratase in catechol pathway